MKRMALEAVKAIYVLIYKPVTELPITKAQLLQHKHYACIISNGSILKSFEA
jgi:hypothetical protein